MNGRVVLAEIGRLIVAIVFALACIGAMWLTAITFGGDW